MVTELITFLPTLFTFEIRTPTKDFFMALVSFRVALEVMARSLRNMGSPILLSLKIGGLDLVCTVFAVIDGLTQQFGSVGWKHD